MKRRAGMLVVIALTAAPVRPISAAETDRVVWKGTYMAPYDVAAECLAREMAGDFGGAAVMQDQPRSVQVRFWHDASRRGQPVAHFHIRPSGDDRAEIGWRRGARLHDASRIDEAARTAAIECGGRSA